MKQTKTLMLALTAIACMVLSAVAAFAKTLLQFKERVGAFALSLFALAGGVAVAAPMTMTIPLFGDLVYDDATYVISSLSAATGVGVIFAVFLGVFTMTLFLVTLRKTSMGGKKTT